MTKKDNVTNIKTHKNITLTKLREEAKEINTMEYYDLDDESRVGFYPTFSFKKIEELQEEMMNITEQASEIGVELNDGQVLDHTLFLIIKHFTHLKSHISDKFENQVAIMETLIETGFFSTMVDEIFPVEEVNKVFTHIGKTIGRSQFMNNLHEASEEATKALEVQNAGTIEEIREIIEETNKVKEEVELNKELEEN